MIEKKNISHKDAQYYHYKKRVILYDMMEIIPYIVSVGWQMICNRILVFLLVYKKMLINSFKITYTSFNPHFM